MSFFPPAPSLTLRTPSGVFVVVLSGAAPLSLRRFMLGHNPRGPGQLLLSSMLVGALHDPGMMHEIRAFYVARGFEVSHKPDYLVLRELAQELEGPALAAHFFSDVDLAGVIPVSPGPGPVIAAAAGPVASWSLDQRLAEMFRLMLGYLPDAVRGEVVAFLSPERLICLQEWSRMLLLIFAGKWLPICRKMPLSRVL